jgi:Na+/proline symporter
VFILAFSAVIAWYISLTPGVPLFVKVQNVFFFIAPPFSVIFCAGLLWRRANTIGALATIVAGFLFSMAFDAFIKGQQGVYLHRAFFTWCFCVIVMAGVSYFTEPPPPEKRSSQSFGRAGTRACRRGEAALPRLERISDLVAAVRRDHPGIYAFFLWFRFQHPVPMLPWSE